MRPLRALSLVLLVVAELAVLVAITLVTSTTIGTGVAGWNWGWATGWGGASEAQTEKFLPIDPKERTLIVRNDMGRVTVHSGTANFGVRAVVRATGRTEADAQSNLDQVTISSAKSDQGMKIESKGPHGWVAGGRTPYADLEVTVPANSTVKVDASMGAVEVHDLTGSIDVVAGMGRVEIARVTGNITVDAKMGRINVDQAVVRDLLDLQAKMGSVTFVGRLGRQNNVEANMGSITLELSKKHPAVDMDATWEMGSLHNSLPLTGENTDDTARGVLGQGKPAGTLRIRSDMGSIYIR